jgi:hypothetical protein
MPGGARDDGFDDDDGDDAQPSMPSMPSMSAPGESPYGTREPQPFIPRDAQPFPQHQQHQPHQPRPQPVSAPMDADVDRLPSFITGGQPQPIPQQGQNGHDNQPDRFPLHRRRRRHRGPRHDMPGGGDGGDESAPRGE